MVPVSRRDSVCDPMGAEAPPRLRSWPNPMNRAIALSAVLWFLAPAPSALPATLQDKKPPLVELSLEELMNTEVTSVSKKQERVSEAAVAIHVISQENIHRLGATTIADALRLSPGLTVARIDSNKWSIGARGFGGRFANKLLVLIDGRSAYTSLFSGVHWDIQDVLLDDVDRIEVIRGPGATLWGANAVNGVINIISKSSAQTQGGLLSGGVGTREQGFGAVRYGGKLGEKASHRVYAKYFKRDGFVDAQGADAGDRWDALRGGFRIDADVSPRDSLTLSGDIYSGRTNGTVTLPDLSFPFQTTRAEDAEVSGGNVLGRFKRVWPGGAALALQAYYDHSVRMDSVHREAYDTIDLDLQHRFTLSKSHEMFLGLGFRNAADELVGSSALTFAPGARTDRLWSGFIQNEFLVSPEKLRVTLGSKFEHNAYTGFEIQPSARLLFTPSLRQTLWASASRAVRTPSRFEHDARVHLAVLPPTDLGQPLALIDILGSKAFASEELFAYEAGYRWQPTPRLFLDVAAFFNVYDNFRSLEPGLPSFSFSPQPLHAVVELKPENKFDGKTRGLEAAASFSPSKRIQLSASYSWLRVRLTPEALSMDTITKAAEGDAPVHQFQFHSFLDLPRSFSINAALSYVGRISNQEVPAWLRADLNLGWRNGRGLALNLTGQNLLQPRHAEWGTSFLVNTTQVPPSVYLKATWQF